MDSPADAGPLDEDIHRLERGGIIEAGMADDHVLIHVEPVPIVM